MARRRRRSCTPTGGRRASPGSRRSTPRSPPRPRSSTSTTSPTRTRSSVRVAGPFTVESLSPHRVLGRRRERRADRPASRAAGRSTATRRADFAADDPREPQDRRRAAGAQGGPDHASPRSPPGRANYICAEGRYMEGEQRERRAGDLHRPRVRHRRPRRPRRRRARGRRRRLRRADRLRLQLRRPRLRARQARPHPGPQGAHEPRPAHGRRPEEHRQGQPVRRSSASPTSTSLDDGGRPDPGEGQRRRRVRPATPARSAPTTPTASPAWFIDTDYNEESFFVRHAYFLGANDPYKALKTTLKAEIDEDAWATLYSDTSRPFAKPTTGRIAVKVINHLGDEVMKVFRVG